ncbi:porin family protein [Flavobacterium johnsoniae]|uniref:Outer membrane protein beta-barrel domain-containing protein n=1 Tax=Flavobacterium johnsoniae TaxID=986 RepID=A0A1M5KK16_FLAJO|nr:porin family protein [Flavobacterium johnsoniae]SHG53065.1 Outer membrane protein beta-barrel domain-containing protein [Flavobacterium johnsoniae]
MKKIILAAIAVMAFSFANAQETRFGVKGGLNISTVGGDARNVSSLVGFHVGGFAEIKIIEKLAIQPELLFSTQGAKEKFAGDKYNTNLNYINVPVLAKYYITKQFTVEAGPQIGFLVSAKSDGEDVKDFYRSVDAGFNIGAGYNFTENLSVGLRYYIGLSNVIDENYEDWDDYVDSYKVNNNVFSVSLAYKF